MRESMGVQADMRSFFLDVLLLSGIIGSYLPPYNGLGRFPSVGRLPKVYKN